MTDMTTIYERARDLKSDAGRIDLPPSVEALEALHSDAVAFTKAVAAAQADVRRKNAKEVARYKKERGAAR